jgi:hypothetical protein
VPADPPVSIDPEPPEDEREAILAALAGEEREQSAWGEAALAEGVEAAPLHP